MFWKAKHGAKLKNAMPIKILAYFLLTFLPITVFSTEFDSIDDLSHVDQVNRGIVNKFLLRYKKTNNLDYLDSIVVQCSDSSVWAYFNRKRRDIAYTKLSTTNEYLKKDSVWWYHIGRYRLFEGIYKRKFLSIDESFQFFHKAEEILFSIQNYCMLSVCYRELQAAYGFKLDLGKSMQMGKKAVQNCKYCDNENWRADAYFGYARQLVNNHYYNESLLYMDSAYTIYLANNDVKNEILCNQFIGKTLMRLKKYEDAILALTLTEDEMKFLSESKYLASQLSIAEAYIEMGEAKKSNEILENCGQKKLSGYVNRLHELLRVKHEIEFGDLDSAKKMALNWIADNNKTNCLMTANRIMYALSKIYYLQGEPKESLHWAKESFKHGVKGKRKEALLKWCYHNEFTLKHYQNADGYLKKYFSYSDSINQRFSVEKLLAVTTKKEKLYEVMRTKLKEEKRRSAMQKAQLKITQEKLRNQKILLVVLIVLLLLAGLIIKIYKSLKSTRKTNQLLFDQTKKLRGEILKANQTIQEKENSLNELNSRQKLNVKELTDSIRGQGNWTEFLVEFSNIHSDFIREIQTRHTNLTKTDLRLAILLKLNLNNEEMAEIMCISYHGLRKAKLRLKKKLDKMDDVESYIHSLGA